MKSPKEVNNQVIVEDDLVVEKGIISEEQTDNGDSDWDDNKQHTEQHFF
jgi:hypothetical protein